VSALVKDDIRIEDFQPSTTKSVVSKPIDVIIDGSNVAYDNVPKGEPPRYRNIWLALEYYAKNHLNVRVIVDPSLRHEIDDVDVFQEALDQKLITQSPAGIQADEYILRLAVTHPNAKIVSNDTFEDWQQKENGEEYEEIKHQVLSKPERLIKFKINGKFIEFT
jgi:hypothetical protein